MTERTAGNHGVKPRDAHRMLVRELAAQGRGTRRDRRAGELHEHR